MPKQKERKKLSDGEVEEPVSRLKALENKDKGYLLPPLGKDEQDLIHWFFDMGPTLPSSMGASPLSQSEILAWQSNNGIELRPWQVRLMRRLSLEYINESHESENENRAEPYMTLEIVEFNRDDIAKRLSQKMRSMMAAQSIKGSNGRNSSRP